MFTVFVVFTADKFSIANAAKTRQVAVYLETHCNIGLKRAFPTGVLDR